MFCSECGKGHQEAVQFCRHCGARISEHKLVRRRNLPASKSSPGISDADELTSNGIGSVIMGDGFFMVAVILSATHSPVSSLLWLFLLIPAFLFFGKGFADVLHAKQIRRSDQLKELMSIQTSPSMADALCSAVSGDLQLTTSVTERTTRELRL